MLPKFKSSWMKLPVANKVASQPEGSPYSYLTIKKIYDSALVLFPQNLLLTGFQISPRVQMVSVTVIKTGWPEPLCFSFLPLPLSIHTHPLTGSLPFVDSALAQRSAAAPTQNG